MCMFTPDTESLRNVIKYVKAITSKKELYFFRCKHQSNKHGPCEDRAMDGVAQRMRLRETTTYSNNHTTLQ